MYRPYIGLRPWRRHSFVLAVAGLVYICYGLALFLVPASPSRATGLVLAVRVMPLDAWAIVWMIVGSLALASTRWPPQSETWGYAAMTGMSSLWAALYLLGMAFADTPGRNVSAILVWALVSFMWWAISGLQNPDDIPPPEEE